MKELIQKFEVGDIITNGKETFEIQGIYIDKFYPERNSYILETSQNGGCDRILAFEDQNYWYRKKRIMKAPKATKLLGNVLNGSEEKSTGNDKTRSVGNFSCNYVDEDYIKSQARWLDRQLFNPNKKIDGGMRVQNAIAFIQRHKDIANKVKIRWVGYEEAKTMGDIGNYAFHQNQIVEYVGCSFEQSDLDYALSMFNLK